jgi:hypothetical protein
VNTSFFKMLPKKSGRSYKHGVRSL